MSKTDEYMKATICSAGRVLSMFLLCAGFIFSGCTEDLWGDESQTVVNTAGGVTITVDVTDITITSVQFNGTLALSQNYAADSFGILYSQMPYFTEIDAQKLPVNEIYGEEFSFSVFSLKPATTYYYASYIKIGEVNKYSEIRSFTTLPLPYDIQSDLDVASATDLSASGSANSYIVSQKGLYKFKPVKGNSSISVGSVVGAEILWEAYGTYNGIEMLDLIKAFCYKDGYIVFQTADTFREGNAVIAAKAAENNILWSWHIWFTDEPEGQEYYNDAGVMMDRNLGATSATPGDVGALGLLYQWGRKDPFLGSSSISTSKKAFSTITWPSASGVVLLKFAIMDPLTFGTSINNGDWCVTDETRWTTSDAPKSIYDPCPHGWRVPDGGADGPWAKAIGYDSLLEGYPYDSTDKGMNLSGILGDASTIWYPVAGYLSYDSGRLDYTGKRSSFWSAYSCDQYAYMLAIDEDTLIHPSGSLYRAYGCSVRCIQE